jgi:lipopolysaccharide assembly outer membrane protein LptD (OstA)
MRLAAILAVFILFFAVYAALKAPQVNLFFGPPPDKVIEFKNARLVGRADGEKQWELEAERIWSTKNQNITTFEDVKDGVLFKKGRVIVKGLKARQVKYYKWTEEIEGLAYLAGASGEAPLLEAFIDVENLSSKKNFSGGQRFVKLFADRIFYSKRRDLAEITGNVRIFEKDLSVFTQRMDVAGIDRSAVMTGGVRVKKAATTISSDKLTADFESELYNFTGCVALTQKNKAAVSERAVFENLSSVATLEGSVRLLIEKGEALLEHDTVQKLKNLEIKETLKEKTLLTSDRLTLSTTGGNAIAEGSVEISQKGKRARSDRAVYDEKAEAIFLSGNVFIEREGQWLKTAKVIVSVSSESFVAEGSVEAEFKIQK